MTNKKRFITLTPILTPFLTVTLLVLLSVSGSIIKSQAEKIDGTPDFLLMVSVVQLIVFFFPCVIYYFLRGRSFNTNFLASPFGPGQVLFVVFATMLLITGNLLIKCIYYIALIPPPGGINYLVSDLPADYPPTALAVIIAVALIPAICEEVFFRGVVFSEYRVYGAFNAVVFSAICFAMIHFSLEFFPLYFYSGLVLGLMAAVTKSIFAPIAAHFVSNLLSIFVSDSFLRITIQKSGGFFAAFLSASLFLMSLVLVLTRAEGILWKRSKTVRDETPLPKSAKNIAAVFLSPGFFGLALVFILIIVLK